MTHIPETGRVNLWHQFLQRVSMGIRNKEVRVRTGQQSMDSTVKKDFGGSDMQY